MDSILFPQHSFALIPHISTTIAMILTLGKGCSMIDPLMVKQLAMARRWGEAANREGGQSPPRSPARHGIRGNTHLMMQDNNSHDIAAMVLQRLAGTNAPAPPP